MRVTVDIAIVGAGPGGLAAAHAIASAAPHLKVAVFERSCASITNSRRGAGLGLDLNGQKALQAINPELLRQVVAMAPTLHTNRVMNPEGDLVVEVPYGQGVRKDLAELGFKFPCLLGWSELQKLLAESLPDSVTVQTGMEFDRYGCDEASGCITALFKPSSNNGSTAASRHTDPSTPTQQPAQAAADAGQQPEQPQQPQQQQAAEAVVVTAQLLVAADGYFSRVRRQCLADGPPEWGETLVYRARLPAAAAAAAGVDLADCSLFVQDVGRFVFAYPITSGHVVWTVGVTDEMLGKVGLSSAAIREQLYANSTSSTAAATQAAASTTTTTTTPPPPVDYTDTETQGYSPQETAAGTAAKGRCLQVLQGFWPPMLQLVKATPAASLVEHGVYTRPASSVQPSWFGRGRVVIVGDAAHPLRPTGQGLNQTLEDAWALGKALQDSTADSGSSSSAGGGSGGCGESLLEQLDVFRRRRAERIGPVVAFTTESGKASYTAAKETNRDRIQAAAKALGQDGDSMTMEQFSEYCCSAEFERLGAQAPGH